MPTPPPNNPYIINQNKIKEGFNKFQAEQKRIANLQRVNNLYESNNNNSNNNNSNNNNKLLPPPRGGRRHRKTRKQRRTIKRRNRKQ